VRTHSTGRRLLLPFVAGLAILSAAPFFGRLRDWLLGLMPREFAAVLTVGFAAVLLVTGALGLRRIDSHRWLRIGGCLVAGALVGVILMAFGRGPADVSAVERFHILEYGLLAGLFYWALRPRAGGWAVPIALLAAAIVGVLDETVQWLVPTRVGEMRDILLNWSAVSVGLLAAGSIAPPRSRPPDSGRVPRVVTGLLAGVLVIASAGFFDMAHLGERIVDAERGLVFRSWFSAETLRGLSAARSRRWESAPPGPLRPLSLEDYFLTEATAHVRQRNEALRRDDARAAWGEERILEHWYAPVLRMRGLESGRSMALGPGARQRLSHAAQGHAASVYQSPALSRRIFVEPSRSTLWWTAGAMAAIALLLGMALPRRKP
jgi:hypothetical protein